MRRLCRSLESRGLGLDATIRGMALARTDNARAASEFLTEVAAGRVREAYGRHVAVAFKHHNVHFPGDRESLLQAMQDSATCDPNKAFVVKQVIESGDRVVVMSHLRRMDADQEFAVVHILRFVDGKIVEMWDVAQAIPADSPNVLGAF